MFARYITKAIEIRQEKIAILKKDNEEFVKPKLEFDIWEFSYPLFISLITFSVVLQQTSADSVTMTNIILSFQTGFVWQTILRKEIKIIIKNDCEIRIMLSEKDKQQIRNIAEKYNAAKIILFGSACEPDANSNDIDLAVEGVVPSQFYKFYGELIFNLSKPVDLVDLTTKNRFNDIIVSEGQVIYG